MPGPLTTISIGSAARRANERLARASRADLERYLSLLESTPSVAGPAEQYGPIQNEGHVRHHDEFAGNGPNAFFPQIEASLKNDVLRASLIQALRLSLFQTHREDGTGLDPRPTPLPIVSYWITGSPTFEAYVDVTDREVHIFLVTPDPAPPLSPPPAEDAFDERIWLCASPERVQAIRERAPHYAYRAPTAMPTPLAAVCQQLKGY